MRRKARNGKVGEGEKSCDEDNLIVYGLIICMDTIRRL